MRASVFIDGDQGTTGLQILARLSGRRDIALVTLPDALRKDPAARAAAINDCDVAVLCLPDEAARQAVAGIRHPRVRVIDASSAHRTDAAWVYGFPEMSPQQAGRIAEARFVSNPGCYPTGAVALLRPLVEAGVLRADAPLSIHAISGYSGRGRAGIDAHEGPGAASALPFQTYGLALQHKHVPEIQQHAGLQGRPFFVPSYGAFRQGIALTIPLHASMLQRPLTAQAVRELLMQRYRDHRHVQVLDAERTQAMTGLDPQALNGSNDLQLAVFGNDATGQLLLGAVFDNLGKGASGAAVQNLALMLGLDEAPTIDADELLEEAA
ncbi:MULTISPECIES: N-acetyl-gamma-glutamyl-phosphate reductase [unclassified Rhizobacter]|uniref:N-acetyl-gamma-glutamyl-phosphate reductase n=1 Tax=unclassified Rhizobacter TaxID=2640088 RepID=UPI0006F6CB59|nr:MULTISPECIES: N-acetyl-gamma-glutamyl-phosphate reductase [unclassified Rhizobacter]KQU64554.1 N-acetyl-gamma-glutamyl-phosphate reductase [Rhizobacter sp. Root29]KQW03372.1 N-acetyl-gamma-glutamyl-phosphate reductase [Rhizobacter sp. Root1238]KRB13704.1 N-acetyl-gamma-glutamyl-phosphate reductase [Rhizobacter sp. Root16D2]